MAEPTTGDPTGAPATERPQRLRIEPGGTLRAGDHRASFDPNDDESLLLSYLRLVRAARDQRRTPTIELRRADLETLAGHLAIETSDVVERLGRLMGASLAQRRGMAALLASGVAVLTLGVGTAAALAGDDDPAPAPTLTSVPRTVIASAPVVVSPPTGVPDLEVVVVTLAPAEAESAPSSPPPESTVTVAVPANPVAVTVPVVEPVEVAVGEPPEPVEVAVGEPPVPIPPTPEPPTEPEVAVGEPPVPVPPAPGG